MSRRPTLTASASTPQPGQADRRGRGASASPTALRKRSVIVDGHSTSVTLEHAFWQALKEISAARGCSVAALVARIDRTRGEDPEPPNLSSAIRVFVLNEVSSRTA